MENRRDFLKKSLLTLGAASLGTFLANAIDFSTGAKAKLTINKGDVILFQGDSITDAGRNRENLKPNDGNAFGNGYAFMAASTLLNKYADKDIKVYNRGISGNRVPDLINRWQTDALDLKPNILSIMIGVNDFWRTMDSGAKNSPEQYKAQFKELLDKTKAALPDVKLIIIEPFGVKNVKHVTDAWYPEFPKYLNAAKEIAQEYGAIFLPYQTIFDQGLKRNKDGGYWTTDGVHTTMAGANLMAEAWLNLIK